MSDDELKKLCDEEYSRKIFKNTYPIFVRVPQNASKEEKQKAIKDHNDKNRYTVKYEFSKNGYSYFVTQRCGILDMMNMLRNGLVAIRFINFI